MNQDITDFLSKIANKYSDNAEQKHLNQMYNIGIMLTNKKFNKEKMIKKIEKIIDIRSQDAIEQVREHKRKSLIDALNRGIEDGLSDEYRMAYNSANQYQYNDVEKLKKRAYIDGIIDSLNSFTSNMSCNSNNSNKSHNSNSHQQ